MITKNVTKVLVNKSSRAERNKVEIINVEIYNFFRKLFKLR